MKNSKTVLIDKNPGRNSQTFGVARNLNTDLDLIHEPSIGVVGNKGDSQCYFGVEEKVRTIHECLRLRIGQKPGDIFMRLVQPEYTVATSDGIRNGTKEMRYSLIGKTTFLPSKCLYLPSSGFTATAVSPNIVSGLVVAIVKNSLLSSTGYLKYQNLPCTSFCSTSRSEIAVNNFGSQFTRRLSL